MGVLRWLLFLGSMCALSLVASGQAWALPKWDFDKSWGDNDHHYGKHYKWDFKKWDSKWDYRPRHGDFDKEWLWESKHFKKGYGYHFKKKKKKDHDGCYGDCDPPVATPEPATLILLGSSLAGLGVYAQRRRRPRADGH
jgi:PEP-CTERM motif